MEFVLALIAALSLSSIPLVLGWRRTAGEAALARQLGIAQNTKRFDPQKFALQTGTGLTFNQIAIGFLAWVGGGLFAGFALGFLAAVLFAVAGGLLYAGTLSDRKQEFTLQQAKDILRALGIVETLLMQGKILFDSWVSATNAVGPAGQVILVDLVTLLRACMSGQEATAVREWARAWDNPAADIVATVLYSHFSLSIDVAPMIQSLRGTLSAVVEILSRARAAAKGIEWQAKFLAVFPPFVLVLIGLTAPEAGKIYARNPLYVLPVLVGSAMSYWLSMRMVRNGLSIEASMGLQSEGSISIEKMGAIQSRAPKMQKGLFATAISMIGFLCACSVGFIVMYVVIVGLTIPQLPGWAQKGVEEWVMDIPQFSEHIEDDSYIDNAPGGNQQTQNGGQNGDGNSNGGGSANTLPALVGPVPWSNYVGPFGDIQGFPLWGPITHPWGGQFDAPLIGCTFHDKNYKNHTGFDSPVSVGTPLHATMGGEVVWSGYTKGGWGRLVIIENGDYQIWMAHLAEIEVQVGEIVEPGQVIGLSGGDRTQDDQAGNSSGPHLHYGVKKRTGPDTYVWVDPASFFDLSEMTP